MAALLSSQSAVEGRVGEVVDLVVDAVVGDVVAVVVDVVVASVAPGLMRGVAVVASPVAQAAV